MFTGSAKELTDLARRFFEPANSTHRQYEALRAFFVEGLSAVEAAAASATPRAASASSSISSASEPERDFFVPAGQGAAAARQAEPAPRTGRRPAQAEPLRPRHQPRPGPTRASRSARRPSPRSSRTRASPSCRDAPTTSGPTGPRPVDGRCRRRPPARPDPAALSAPSSAACSCSCPTLAAIPFDRIARQAAASPDRRWSRPAAPCGRCWP